MSNPQDNKRPDQQNENPKPGHKPPTESDSKPERRQGQGGREYPTSADQKKKVSTDEESDDQGNR